MGHVQTNIEWLREKAEVGISMWKDDRELGARLNAIADELELAQDAYRATDAAGYSDPAHAIQQQTTTIRQLEAEAEQLQRKMDKIHRITTGADIRDDVKVQMIFDACMDSEPPTSLESRLLEAESLLREALPSRETVEGQRLRARIRAFLRGTRPAVDVRCGNHRCDALISAGEPHVEGCLG